MNVNEDELVGEPIDQVPQHEPTDESCMGRRWEKEDGQQIFQGYCGAWPGKGTDHVGEGRCSKHGGAGGSGGQREHSGAPEDNTNAVTHGAYADANSYYQNVLSDELQSFVDDVFADYVLRYHELHGDGALGDDEDPTNHIPLGIESELFRVAVTHAKDIGLDRWADEKPDGLESGHPLVDEETEIVPVGEGQTETQRRYRESVVLAAQKKLSNDRRMWLKDLGLLEDPESQSAASRVEMADALREALDS